MPVTLDLDVSIDKIGSKAAQVKNHLEGINGSYKDLKTASEDALKGATSGMDSFTKGLKGANDGLGKQKGLIEDLEDYLKRLEKGQRSAQDVGTVKKYNTEIAKTRKVLSQLKTAGVAGLKAVNTQVKTGKALFTSLKSTIATTFAPLLAAGAAVEGLRKLVSAVRDFEQGAADLSAITGATGQDLEYLKQSAVEAGTETTASAVSTLEAYKLIASAKPELLQNAEALASITRNAITLSEASGGELTQSITNLADIMNQFNAPAEEAVRYVNALAAGSKQGSAEVDQIASAMLASGTVMKSANVQFEEGVALIEALAERGKKGAEAGTGLRNVISKLSATEVLPKDAITRLQAAGVGMGDLSDKSLSFTDRLRALKPIQNDANALVKVFGLENLATAQILLDQIDRTEDLRDAVTGTNTAYEQAAVRTSTMSGEWERLKNTVTALVQGSGGGLSQLLAFLIRLVREGVVYLHDRLKDLQPAFSLIVQAGSELVGALKQLFPAQDKVAESSGKMGRAFEIINVPVKLFFVLLKAGIGVITDTVSSIAGLIKNNGKLSTFFKSGTDNAKGFIDIFVALPGYVNGGIEAVKVFLSEVRKGFAELGSNIGGLLREAFNFKKLISEGTGDLKTAVAALKVNVFEGSGQKAADAFKKGFDEVNKKPIDVRKKPTTATPTDTSAVQSAAKAGADQNKIERARLAAMKDGVDKQIALENFRYKDLIEKLDKYGLDTEEATEQHELNKLRIKKQYLDDLADLEGIGGAERVAFIYQQTKKEIDALESALSAESGRSLGAEQLAQLNLLRKKASEEYTAGLEAFYDKDIKSAQSHEIAKLELNRDSFETQKDFEEYKEKEILDIKLKYAKQQLALIESLKGAESEAALAIRGTINELNGQLAQLGQSGASGEFSLLKLLGVDTTDTALVGAINTAVETSLDVLGQVNDLRLEKASQALEASQAEIQAIDDEIDAKRSALESEKELAAEGYANNVEGLDEDIALLEERRAREEEESKKALEKKKQIQREQAVLDTLTQGSSMITAAANIYSSLSLIPFAGVPLAIGLIGTMVASFAAAKAKIFKNISAQKAEKGMHTVLQGNRHTQGGIPVTDGIEAEGGESLGILSRKATKEHGKLHGAFVNAANKGDTKALRSLALSMLPGVDTAAPGRIRKMISDNDSMRDNAGKDLSLKELKESNNLLRKMISDNSDQLKVTQVGDKTVYKKGNKTRVVNG